MGTNYSWQIDPSLNWLQNLTLWICWFGQFLLPFYFAITYSTRKKKAKKPISFWGIFLFVVLTTLISSFMLNILTFIYCVKAFNGSGNFGGLIFILFYFINIILSIIVAIVSYLAAKSPK
jgi:hypothetical protein